MYTKNGPSTYPLEKLKEFEALPVKEVASKYGISEKNVYACRNKIKNAGGAEAFFNKYQKTAVKKVVKPAAKVVKKEVSYKEELEFLKESGVFPVLVNTIKQKLPVLLVDRYIMNLCKMIHDEKIMANPSFFIDFEAKMISLMEVVLADTPIPEKVVEVEVEKVVEKVVERKVDLATIQETSPLKLIYTPEKIVKEYPKFFVNPLQVNNYISLHLDKLINHFIKVGNQYIVDEIGAITLLELADKTNEEYPISAMSEAAPETVEVEKELPSTPVFNKPDPKKFSITGSLLDRTAKPSKKPREIKGFYMANKELFNSLNAFRYWTDTHDKIMDAGDVAFHAYCNSESEMGLDCYRIKCDGASTYLYIKKADFNEIMSVFYKENRLGPMKIIKILEVWKNKGLMLKESDISKSYLLDYDKIKQMITEKGGLLNSINFL